jgi:uncharacterized protein (TIGR03435 family)
MTRDWLTAMWKAYVAVGIVLFVLMYSTRTQAQAASPSPSVSPSFEVASIKPVREGDHTRVSFNYNSLVATGVTLKDLIELAYNVNDSQLSGTSGWANSARYEVQAKMDDATAETLKKLPTEQKQEQRRLMVQSLLAERFKLKVSQSSKELPIYVLASAKKGASLSQTNLPDNATSGITTSRGQTKFSGISLLVFVNWLSQQVGRKVVDQTGLQGKYDFTLNWAPESKGPAPDNQDPASLAPDSSGPSIFTALQEQLGLKLESTKGPVQILVIDAAEKPTEN